MRWMHSLQERSGEWEGLAAYPGKGPLAVFRTKNRWLWEVTLLALLRAGFNPGTGLGRRCDWLLQLLESSLRSSSQQE